MAKMNWARVEQERRIIQHGDEHVNAERIEGRQKYFRRMNSAVAETIFTPKALVKCRRCGARVEVAKVNRHMRKVTLEDAPDSDGQYRCPQCAQPFKTHDKAQKHLLKKHGRVLCRG